MATKEDILKESGAETATYIDENGERKTGTVLRGYIDAAADADYYGAQSDIYKGMLESQQQANQSAADAAADEALINAERQTEKVNTAYDASDKELFRGYKKAVRDLPQQLAAMGATGGLSETSRVELETGYGENRNRSQLQRMAEIAELTAAADAAKRQAKAAADQQNAAALLNYYSQLAGLGDRKYQEDLAKLQQGAEMKAAVGDFSGYVDLGLMTEDDAAKMLKIWIAENPELAKMMGYVSAPSGRGHYTDYGASEEEMATLEEWAKDMVGRSSSERDVETNVGLVARQVESMLSAGQITNEQAALINYAAEATGVLRNHS